MRHATGARDSGTIEIQQQGDVRPDTPTMIAKGRLNSCRVAGRGSFFETEVSGQDLDTRLYLLAPASQEFIDNRTTNDERLTGAALDVLFHDLYYVEKGHDLRNRQRQDCQQQ